MSLERAERENVVRTYCALAATMPQVRIEETAEAVVCTGPFPHPLSNFGVIWTEAGGPTVLRAAEGRHYFAAYVFDRSLALDPRNYRVAQELVLMRLDNPAAGEPAASAGTADERLGVARFMASQFFGGHKGSLRSRIAEANALARSLEFFPRYEEGRRIAGAGMLHVASGVVGLYNVCVASALRGQGVGSEIVRKLVGEAGRRAMPVVLQCDRNLTSWYGRFGFVETGTLQVWTSRNG